MNIWTRPLQLAPVPGGVGGAGPSREGGAACNDITRTRVCTHAPPPDPGCSRGAGRLQGRPRWGQERKAKRAEWEGLGASNHSQGVELHA